MSPSAAPDPRCAYVSGDGHSGRCQLWAGHSGPHALMFARDRQRVVRSWTDQRRAEWQDLTSGYEILPWMRGYPIPTWQERP